MTERKTVKMVLRLVNSPSTVSFLRKSGRLTFKGRDERKLYLDLKRIRRAALIIPRAPLNVPPSHYLIEYETDNESFYASHSIVPPEEVEAARQRGEIELRNVDYFVVITEWDADEPMEWYEIYMNGSMQRYSYLDALDEL